MSFLHLYLVHFSLSFDKYFGVLVYHLNSVLVLFIGNQEKTGPVGKVSCKYWADFLNVSFSFHKELLYHAGCALVYAYTLLSLLGF